MSTTTSTIADALRDLASTFTVAQYADQCAVGVWTDDPAAPGCSAVVFQGKLYALVIPDAYADLPSQSCPRSSVASSTMRGSNGSTITHAS